MFKRSLIRKLEEYLGREYLGFLDADEGYVNAERPKQPMPNSHIREKFLQAPNAHIQEKFLQAPSFASSTRDVAKYIDDSLEKVTFANKLNQYMFEKELTTAVIYRRCLVDRKLISKITTQEEYHPSKNTVFALCIGLQLNLRQGEEFLSLAGYSFNRSNKYDLIIKFMLENEIYDLDTINEMLLHFGQPCFE